MPPALEEIYNFLRLSETIGTSGQPTREQLPAIKTAGYEVLINLLPATETLKGEQEWAEAEGLEYVGIPVLWTEPEVGDITRFFEVLEANEGKRLYIHCAANMRVSAFMYLYRTLQKGVPEAEALPDLYRIWTPNPLWQKFIAKVTSRNGSK